MNIVSIDIERHDGKACCGTLEFEHGREIGVLLWTVEWCESPDVTVELFSGTEFEVADLVRKHQKPLIDRLLETVAQRVGRETLLT